VIVEEGNRRAIFRLGLVSVAALVALGVFVNPFADEGATPWTDVMAAVMVMSLLVPGLRAILPTQPPPNAPRTKRHGASPPAPLSSPVDARAVSL
jgi:hypothetical protein